MSGGRSRGGRAIPVAVLAGFLGAGKTTLLNHLLRNRAGRRIGVLVNDFGRIGVDAMAVAGQVDAMVKLGNGCLCCAVDVAGLDAMLSRLTVPALRLDAVVIEASGLAEPREMVRQVLSSTDPHVTYGGLIEVVDAEHFEELRRQRPHVAGHVAVADLVVVTKADRVDPARLARVRGHVEELARGRPVVVTSHGRVDPALLFDTVDPTRTPRGRRPVPEQLSLADLDVPWGADPAEGQHGPAHLHEGYAVVDVELDEPLEASAFLAFLEGRPRGLYRAKGVVTFAGPGRPVTLSVQAVGDHLVFGRVPPAAAPAAGCALTLIGSGLDVPAVRSSLAACVAREPVTAADGALGRVLVLAGVVAR